MRGNRHSDNRRFFFSHSLPHNSVGVMTCWSEGWSERRAGGKKRRRNKKKNKDLNWCHGDVVTPKHCEWLTKSLLDVKQDKCAVISPSSCLTVCVCVLWGEWRFAPVSWEEAWGGKVGSSYYAWCDPKFFPLFTELGTVFQAGTCGKRQIHQHCFGKKKK